MIGLRARQNRTPDYLELNPKHQVPLLIIDGKKTTTSCVGPAPADGLDVRSDTRTKG